MAEAHDLDGLLQLARVVKDTDAARLADVLAEERRIRMALSALDDATHNAKDVHISETVELRRLGGDVAWQIWAGRRRKDLQIQLARVLARKGAEQQRLRKSFGRQSALEQVLEKSKQSQFRESLSRQPQMTTDLALLKSGSLLRDSK